MCGAESLPEQAKVLGDDWIAISANEHGVKLLGDRVDYIVALDNIPQKVHDIGPPVIGIYLWAQYRLCNFWDAGNSGIQAAWVAHAMGCNPIVIAGADCYQNGTYFWDKNAVSSGTAIQLSSHLQAWQKLLNKGNCDRAAIRAVGGPLVEVFGRYEPGEYERPRPFELRKQERGVLVKPGTLLEITRPTAVGGEHYNEGRRARFGMQAARELLLLGKAKIVEEEPVEHRISSGSAVVPDDVRPERDRGRKRRAGAAR